MTDPESPLASAERLLAEALADTAVGVYPTAHDHARALLAHPALADTLLRGLGADEVLEKFMVAFEETGVHEHERDDDSIDLCIPIAPLKPVYWAACAAVGHRWTVVDVEPFCERCGFRDGDDADEWQDAKAPPPTGSEGGAVSAIADHSTEGISGPPAIDAADADGRTESRRTTQGPPVEADGAARTSYRRGLTTKEHRRIRELAEARLANRMEEPGSWDRFLEAAFAVADLLPIATCPACDRLFVPHDGRQTTYCSVRCQQRASKRRQRLARPGPTDGPSQRGEGGWEWTVCAETHDPVTMTECQVCGWTPANDPAPSRTIDRWHGTTSSRCSVRSGCGSWTRPTCKGW